MASLGVTERSLFSSLANRPGGFQGKAGDLILAREPDAFVPGGVLEEFVERLDHLGSAADPVVRAQ
jgi:hypothetical protein